MRAQGLALGGSLENAIVMDEHRVLNSDGLRYDDEFVKHKVLDAIGDLYLLGHPLIGAYHGPQVGSCAEQRAAAQAAGGRPAPTRWSSFDRSEEAPALLQALQCSSGLSGLTAARRARSSHRAGARAGVSYAHADRHSAARVSAPSRPSARRCSLICSRATGAGCTSRCRCCALPSWPASFWLLAAGAPARARPLSGACAARESRKGRLERRVRSRRASLERQRCERLLRQAACGADRRRLTGGRSQLALRRALH